MVATSAYDTRGVLAAALAVTRALALGSWLVGRRVLEAARVGSHIKTQRGGIVQHLQRRPSARWHHRGGHLLMPKEKNFMKAILREEEIEPTAFKDRREGLGLTVQQLAGQAGLSPQRLQAIEANPATCNAEEVEAIDKVLKRLEARQKTKRELEAMIRERSGALPITRLEVRPDPVFGWHTFVVAHPRDVTECTTRVEAIAQELRAQFDLKPYGKND
jgi:transcriptional regulator with XRE-family HTH domain